METKLSILFYSKTSKTTKDGLVPIYLRVTINGARFEQSTQRYIPRTNGQLILAGQEEIRKKPGQLTIFWTHYGRRFTTTSGRSLRKEIFSTWRVFAKNG